MVKFCLLINYSPPSSNGFYLKAFVYSINYEGNFWICMFRMEKYFWDRYDKSMGRSKQPRALKVGNDMVHCTGE